MSPAEVKIHAATADLLGTDSRHNVAVCKHLSGDPVTNHLASDLGHCNQAEKSTKKDWYVTATELSKVWEIAEMFGYLSLYQYRVKSEAIRGLHLPSHQAEGLLIGGYL